MKRGGKRRGERRKKPRWEGGGERSERRVWGGVSVKRRRSGGVLVKEREGKEKQEGKGGEMKGKKEGERRTGLGGVIGVRTRKKKEGVAPDTRFDPVR